MATETPTRPMAAPPSARGPRRPPRRIPVFNPSDWADDVQAGGRMYHFPAQGIALIEDMKEWPRNEQTGALITTDPLRRPTVEGNDADGVADLIVSDDVRGMKGFIILEGTPDTWDDQKNAAREKWVAQHEAQVEADIASWEAKCAGASAQGLPMPTQPKRVVLAYSWRKRHRSGLTRNPELICQVCAHYAADQAELQQHMRDEHPKLAGQMAVAAQPPAPIPVPPTPPAVPVGRRPRAAAAKPVEASAPPIGDVPDDETEEERLERERMQAEDKAPPAVESALSRLTQPVKPPTKQEKIDAGKGLAARALAEGLELSVADKKGLFAGDTDVIEDVTTRVTAYVSRKALKAEQLEKAKE